MTIDMVAQGYNQIAARYLLNRDRLKSGKYIQHLLKYLPKHASILDLGCGAGVPVDTILLKAGHHVVGIDIAMEQIMRARRNCPAGEYRVGDISQLTTGEYNVQAVIAFYSIFHTPRSRQVELFQKLASFLPKGGMLLVTMGDRPFEGEHMLYGVKLWSSHYGTVKNRAMVEQTGFRVLLDEIDVSAGERHQVLLAQKI